MKKIIYVLLTVFLFCCNTNRGMDIMVGPDGTKITTPEMEYDSSYYEDPPSANQDALDDAIKKINEE